MPAASARGTPGDCGSVVPPTVISPATVLLRAGEDAQQLAAPRAGETADAEHLAAVHVERDVLHAAAVEALARSGRPSVVAVPRSG